MSLVLFWHIQSKVNKRDEAPFWWPTSGHSHPPKPPPKDNWVRDGSKPPKDESYDSITVIVVLFDGRKGAGYWAYGYEYWVITPNGQSEGNFSYVLAWQKFPDYEKI